VKTEKTRVCWGPGEDALTKEKMMKTETSNAATSKVVRTDNKHATHIIGGKRKGSL